jgi:hypothetical protein
MMLIGFSLVREQEDWPLLESMNTRVAGSKGALDDTLTLELQAS